VSFALGVVLFALAIGVSIALHEAGHMWTAKAFGMKVRRYFIGFGPKIFSFRRGETEYGVKWIPAGGFCDIAGMTALDPITEDELPRAFFTRKTWQRVVVLSAGSAMHFIIGIVVLYVMAVVGFLPKPGEPLPPMVGVTECVAPSQNPVTGDSTPCPPGAPDPATKAGLRKGDRIVSVAGKPTDTFDQVAAAVRLRQGSTPFVLDRDGKRLEVTVDVVPAQRLPLGAQQGPGNKLVTVGAIGIEPYGIYSTKGPIEAVPIATSFAGDLFAATGQGIKMFPHKVPAVLAAIAGKQDNNRPVSVVGASIIGGEAAQQGSWQTFLMLLVVLNFFVGVFNLVPLLPLDGGHIAVNLYERVRDIVRKSAGKSKMPPVDYTRLLPITYVFVLVFGMISLLTITADIVNPIRLPR
jgi:membrane-associated protease RseP (regulator of RpoE activity)